MSKCVYKWERDNLLVFLQSLNCFRCDQHAHSEVTQRDIREFEKTWKIPVLKVKNVLDSTQADVNDTITIMNTLCEYLWQRDLILAGKLINETSNTGVKSQRQLTNETSNTVVKSQRQLTNETSNTAVKSQRQVYEDEYV